MTIPLLETERTLLRPHRPGDLDAYAALYADPVVTRFIGARNREESWGRMLRYAGMWQFIGFGLWVVEDRASGRLIGEAGFHDVKRDIVPSFDGAPEAGWVFAREVHGPVSQPKSSAVCTTGLIARQASSGPSASSIRRTPHRSRWRTSSAIESRRERRIAVARPCCSNGSAPKQQR